MFILPFSNVSFAQTQTKNYDTKQLIRDVAVLYRKHKLEALAKSDLATKTVTTQKKSALAKKKASKLTKKAKRKSLKLARAKQRKARRIAKARKLLRLKKKAKSSKVAKSKAHYPDSFKRHMTVTATAYTSHVNQTDSTPNIAAWGDRLKPGMKVIAVSRDMLKVYGLKHRSKVKMYVYAGGP